MNSQRSRSGIHCHVRRSPPKGAVVGIRAHAATTIFRFLVLGTQNRKGVHERGRGRECWNGQWRQDPANGNIHALTPTSRPAPRNAFPSLAIPDLKSRSIGTRFRALKMSRLQNLSIRCAVSDARGLTINIRLSRHS